MNIEKTLEFHKKWLRNENGGERANLRGAILRNANLIRANLLDANLNYITLSGANLRGANLRDANLRDADLSGADLRGADLRGADLRGADLRDANLSGADLRGAILRGANLRDANLSDANLSGADLRGAILRGANLRDANLSGANLSGAKGLLSQSEWLDGFEKTQEGIVVFKAIGNTVFPSPEHWDISPGSVLSEVVNPNRTDACGCGVNFGTLDYIKREFLKSDHWKCLIRWEWLADVVVPYNTDGKARCERLELIEIVK